MTESAANVCDDLSPEPPEILSSRDLFHEYVHKLENRTRHLELSIDRNRKRGLAIYDKCFDAIRAMEVLAFDLLVIEYFLDNVPASAVYAFVDSCAGSQLTISAGDHKSVETCAKHVREVQSHIQTSLAALATADARRLDPPKSTGDLLSYLRTQNQKKEHELQSSRDSATTVACGAVTVDLEIPPESSKPAPRGLTPEFEEWIEAAMKPGARAVSVDTAEMRALFGSVVHRMHELRKLKATVCAEKAKTQSTQDMTFSDCDPEDVSASPFLRMAQNSVKFMDSAVEMIRAQQEMVPACASAMATCKRHLQQLKEKCTETVSKIQERTDQLEASIAERQTVVAQLAANARSCAEALNFDPASIQLDDVDIATSRLCNDIEERFRSVIAQRNDMDTRTKVGQQVETLTELRALHKAMSEKCTKNIELANMNRTKQNKFFAVIVESFKNTEVVKLEAREIEDLEKYREDLKTMIDLMDVDHIFGWCSELEEVSMTLASSVNSQKRDVEVLFEQLLREDMGADEVAKMTEEIETMATRSAILVEREATCRSELVAAEEELFQVTQELDGFKESGFDKKEAREYGSMIWCPICKNGRRDCILTTCFHPICGRCVDASRETHTCPICSNPFTDESVKPFFMQ